MNWDSGEEPKTSLITAVTGRMLIRLCGVTASIACISNVGPGLNGVGPTENFSFFSAPAKLLLSFLIYLLRPLAEKFIGRWLANAMQGFSVALGMGALVMAFF